MIYYILISFFLVSTFAYSSSNDVNALKPYSESELEQLQKVKEKVDLLRGTIPSALFQVNHEQQKVLNALKQYSEGKDKDGNLEFLTNEIKDGRKTNYEYLILDKLPIDDHTSVVFFAAVMECSIEGVKIAALNKMGGQITNLKYRDFLVNLLERESVNRSVQSRAAEILVSSPDEATLTAVAKYLLHSGKTKVFMKNFIQKYHPDKVSKLSDLISILQQRNMDDR